MVVAREVVVDSQDPLNISDFISYCLSFYGHGEIYDHGITEAEIRKALDIRLERYPHIGFDGDTLDREKVRDIVLYELRAPFVE